MTDATTAVDHHDGHAGRDADAAAIPRERCGTRVASAALKNEQPPEGGSRGKPGGVRGVTDRGS